MSESMHNSDSVTIYRKDQNNKLHKPKPKRLRRITVEDDMLDPSREEGKYNITQFLSDTDKTTGTTGGGGGSGGY